MKQETERRFWALVDRRDPFRCWPWIGSRIRNGYGQFWLDKLHLAHRIAWRIDHGWEEIPDGKVVRHSCDNKPCCNPTHLLLGTQSDNLMDAVNRDRLNDRAGSLNGRSKLSPEQVSDIRAQYAQGSVKQKDLALQFGVGRQHISSIIRGKTWKVSAPKEES